MNAAVQRRIHDFIFPEMNRNFWIRVICASTLCFLFFKFICKPVFLNGSSMEPNYHSRTLNFCWTPTYRFRKPEKGDVVALRYEGDRVMLLKRIVALENETVEFRKGVLHVNGKPVEEPYVLLNQGKWDLAPRKVSPGCVYVVGDNRSMPIEQHKFGEIRKSRIQGTLLL